MSSSDELFISLSDARTAFRIARLVGVLGGSAMGKEKRVLDENDGAMNKG